jgi:hypothetical protein
VTLELCSPRMKGTLEEPSITGALVSTHLELLGGRFGNDEVNRCIEGLPAEVRADLQGVIAAGWVPLKSYDVFYRTFAERVGADVAELHTEMSRHSVERTFKTLWRLLLRVTSDEALISRTPVLFSRAYTKGRLRAVMTTPGLADVELDGWPAVPDIVLRGVRIAIETVLRLSGRNAVRSSVERAPQGAKIRAIWKP